MIARSKVDNLAKRSSQSYSMSTTSSYNRTIPDQAASAAARGPAAGEQSRPRRIGCSVRDCVHADAGWVEYGIGGRCGLELGDCQLRGDVSSVADNIPGRAIARIRVWPSLPPAGGAPRGLIIGGDLRSGRMVAGKP